MLILEIQHTQLSLYEYNTGRQTDVLTKSYHNHNTFNKLGSGLTYLMSAVFFIMISQITVIKEPVTILDVHIMYDTRHLKLVLNMVHIRLWLDAIYYGELGYWNIIR